MTSFTVTFTGNTSVLRADFLPEIVLDENSNYSCALLDFTSYNSIPNITRGENNKFHFKYTESKDKKVHEKEITFDTGSYECEDILQYLKTQLAAVRISLFYELNAATSRIKLLFNTKIECINDSVLNLIGFSKKPNRIFEANKAQWSDQTIKITNIDIVRVECDIIQGSYINGRNCHTLFTFNPHNVLPGHKLNVIPQHIVYLPIKNHRINSIQISLVDQDDRLVDFRNEQISCRIHIKKGKN